MRDPLDLVGSTVGDEYEVVELVSKGGLSLVYRVINTTDASTLALKCYAGLADLPEPSRSIFRANFRHVGKLIGFLARSYPALVSVARTGSVRVGPERDLPAMLLEWLDGESLDAFLDRDRQQGYVTRAPEDILALMREPMAALAAAHEYGVVHRNIKPGNIFVCGSTLSADTPIKLLDFSLAKLGGGPDQVTFYTPEYGAPEQFRGDESNIGPWTDVFGLALVLVELLLGGRPALRGGDFDALRQASEDRLERPTPRAQGLELPNAVESVFKRALAVEPRDRFPHAGEFLYALERAITCEGRVTSTHISRVSGVLNYQPSEDTIRRRGHPHSQAQTASVPSVVPGVPDLGGSHGDTVVAPSPDGQSGFTVLAPVPDFPPPNE